MLSGCLLKSLSEVSRMRERFDTIDVGAIDADAVCKYEAINQGPQ